MDHLRVSTLGNDTGNVSKRDLRRSGALAMILGGLFPPIGAFFTTLPDCVLGGCTVIMFGSIMMSGIRMMQDADLDQRNVLIAATSLCLGVGVTQVEGFFDNLPPVFGEIFAGNMVAGVFVVGLILELCLPKDPKRYETRQKLEISSAFAPQTAVCGAFFASGGKASFI